MGTVIDLEEAKAIRIQRIRAARLAALDVPPPSEVAWKARRTDGKDATEYVVLAQTWAVARQRAAVVIGCAPEHTTVERA